MTLFGMLFTMAAVITVGILLLRIIPVYLNHYAVKRSIDSLNHISQETLSSDRLANCQLLQRRLLNQLHMNNLPLPDKKIQVTPTNNHSFNVSINYEVKKPLIANVYLLFVFHEEQEVHPGGQ